MSSTKYRIVEESRDGENIVMLQFYCATLDRTLSTGWLYVPSALGIDRLGIDMNTCCPKDKVLWYGWSGEAVWHYIVNVHFLHSFAASWPDIQEYLDHMSFKTRQLIKDKKADETRKITYL